MIPSLEEQYAINRQAAVECDGCGGEMSCRQPLTERLYARAPYLWQCPACKNVTVREFVVKEVPA